MARIRIVDEWLRSPVSPPSRHRAILVVAGSWSEQRVLMRAFSSCEDQTRPTINLHGTEFAIGPAGTDPHGPWGIHVEPPVDGRAQELRGQLELAARRLAGSKGNPPRLVDEQPDFDDKATHLWAPGTPRDKHQPHGSYYEPAEVAPPISSPSIPSSAAARSSASISAAGESGAFAAARMAAPAPGPPSAPPLRQTPPLWQAQPEPGAGRKKRKTAPGFSPGERPGGGARPRSVPAHENLAALVRRTMPLGFQLAEDERAVLNALSKADSGLSARQIGELLGISSPLEWMEEFVSKLARCGVELVIPGRDRGGEPTYVLRR